MAKRRRSSRRDREKQQGKAAFRNILLALVLLAIPVGIYINATIGKIDLDKETLCPSSPAGITILLVDVTDPMNLPQRQDFANQFDRLIEDLPRYNELAISKVDPVSDRLLAPVITRCNPGVASDESHIDGAPEKLDKLRRENFLSPLRSVFDEIAEASSAPRSPILESIQSVALTELQTNANSDQPKKLIIASDLLQNTDDISFYGKIPNADDLIDSKAFRRARTDLRGVEVELWMLERPDARETQPRALANLWQDILEAQGARVTRIYNVSG